MFKKKKVNKVKQAASDIFRSGRRKMTIFYAVGMFLFAVVLMCVVHESMEWALSSEQARDLKDTANDIAYAQSFLIDQPAIFDDFASSGSRNKLFFYVYDANGRLINYSRASNHIESFVLDTIDNWTLEPEDVGVFGRMERQDDKKYFARVMLTAYPVTVNGETVAMVFVGKDVTALYYGIKKSMYFLLALSAIALILATVLGYIMSGKALIPMKEAYERQRQFAADASHELRTPLSVVMASADLLDNDPSIQSPFLKQVIADVKDEVKKMTKLVSDLLVIARSDNQAVVFKPQTFDISAIMEQQLRVMQPLAEKKNIHLYGKGMLPVNIQADEQKIRQLILILVDNAVKYTPEGGEVCLKLDGATGGKVRFSVSDTGIGIAPEDKDRIFDRFYRVDKARSRAMGGNGLGLAIAQEIVSLHGGSINLESKLGEGTTFKVEFKAKTTNKNIELEEG